jgi:serine protease Do
MTGLRKIACWLVPIATVTGSPAIASAETIELVGGAKVEGKIIAEKVDRLVVDLGFRVLEIPMESVERIVVEGGEPAPEGRFFDLYRTSPGREERTIKENMARVAEAVVQVRTPTGLGSGFVIHPNGYVITNQHVVSGEHEITVTLFKQHQNELEKVQLTKVRIISTSPHSDLALLKVEDTADRVFETVPLADSNALRQGQTVFAVGSPLGLDRTVSTGIVSLTNRAIGGRVFVQTTTEINPGNSGGPLFNLRGEVVGVNDLKLVGIGLEGLNFAIPASTLKEFLRNRNAFAFDPRNPNAGFRYNRPPARPSSLQDEGDGQ